jgi:hypothetical protein
VVTEFLAILTLLTLLSPAGQKPRIIISGQWSLLTAPEAGQRERIKGEIYVKKANKWSINKLYESYKL